MLPPKIDFSTVDVEDLFGAEAAEDERADRLIQYFLKTAAWEQVTDPTKKLRILVGRKGTGKSAIFRVAAREDEDAGRLSVIVQPDDFVDIVLDETDHLRLVRSWNRGLTNVILEKMLRAFGAPDKGVLDKLLQTGGQILDLATKALGASFKDLQLDPARERAATAFLAKRELTVYFDDLDRGWSRSTQDATRLGAMIDAVRDMLRENDTLNARVALRTDAFDFLRVTDVASDKYETPVVRLAWTNHEVFVLLVKRVATYFGEELDYADLLKRSQRQLQNHLDPIVEPRFKGVGKWSDAPMHHILTSFARRRPRDLVKLLTFAGREAQKNKHHRITTEDLQAVFPEFSRQRIQDVVNEYKTELPDIEKVLYALKPPKHGRSTRDVFTLPTDQMVRRLKLILESAGGRMANGEKVLPQELLSFLFRIDVLQARKDDDHGTVRVDYDDNALVTPDKIDAGYEWEVHLAFRFALQPDTIEDVFRSSDPTLEAKELA